jgi:hypothetical protein
MLLGLGIALRTEHAHFQPHRPDLGRNNQWLCVITGYGCIAEYGSAEVLRTGPGHCNADEPAYEPASNLCQLPLQLSKLL